ncbi:MAG: DUF5684 domain-containing protein [Phycisphaerales bacterium]|nr:DUF5684 domain-containing protein [Phycisphaerales bacterium]
MQTMLHAMLMQADSNNLQGMSNGEVVASAAALGGALIFLLIYLIIVLIMLIGLWKMFSKAGIPGILALIPLVHLFFIPQVAGKPNWWGILLLVPVVNIVISILICIGVAERFGRGVGTVLGLIFLAPIFTCILGLGSAKWTPPPAAA